MLGANPYSDKKNILQLNIAIKPELFLLGLIDKELEKIGN